MTRYQFCLFNFGVLLKRESYCDRTQRSKVAVFDDGLSVPTQLAPNDPLLSEVGQLAGVGAVL